LVKHPDLLYSFADHPVVSQIFTNTSRIERVYSELVEVIDITINSSGNGGELDTELSEATVFAIISRISDSR
jgi:hypothetical protein